MTYPIVTVDPHPTRQRTHEGRTVSVEFFPGPDFFGRPQAGTASLDGSPEAIAHAIAEAERMLPGHDIKEVTVSPLRCFQSCRCAFDTARDIRVKS